MVYVHRLPSLNHISHLNFFIKYPIFIKNPTAQILMNMKKQIYVCVMRDTTDLKVVNASR